MVGIGHEEIVEQKNSLGFLEIVCVDSGNI
jgi:hypothetical protein